MSTEEKINSDYVIGVICYKNVWSTYFMPPIYWVTDSDYYDPDYNPARTSDKDFRGGVGKLSSANAEAYFKAIAEDYVSPAWLRENYLIYKDDLKPIFLVNIDEHLFISNFYDVDYENHAAPGWKSLFDDPLKYMPDELKKIWS